MDKHIYADVFIFAAMVPLLGLTWCVIQVHAADIIGGLGNDTLIGTPDSDRIAGLEGNDRITGQESDDALSGGDGNDTVFLSKAEGDTAENDCEVVNPSSIKLEKIADTFLGNATENSQSNRTDIDQNCELAVAQSNGILDIKLCQKIKLSSIETPDFVPMASNTNKIGPAIQSKAAGNLSKLCPSIISRGSDDVAIDICRSFISASSNQTNNQ